MSETKKLTPPDTRQCQAEKQVGAFVLGGRIGERTRCTATPTVIAIEKKPGSDGLCGSMSLCASCLEVARSYFGPGQITVEPIRAAHPEPAHD